MNNFLFSTVFIGGLFIFFIAVAAIAKYFNLDSYIKTEHKKTDDKKQRFSS